MYALIQNNKVIEFPYSVVDFRYKHKNISFPNTITEEIYNQFDVYSVYGVEYIPDYDRSTQKVEFGEVTLIDGKWYCTYNIVELNN